MIQSKTSIPGIAGVVLCGGDSRRMGTDKGLILKDGVPWFRRIGKLMESLALPVFYSIRLQQFEAYKAYTDAPSLIIDDNISEGPLRGVITVMKATNADRLLVIACDMQELDRPLIESLIDVSGKHEHEFYAYSDGRYYQPFPGIYTKRGLENISGINSLQQLLQKGDTFALSLPGTTTFPNYNELP